MSQPPNTNVLKVTAVLDGETVFVSDVAEGHDPCTTLGFNDRLVRSKEMARAGENTFWKVDGETLSAERETDPSLEPALLLRSSKMSFTNVRAGHRGFVMPAEYVTRPKPAPSEVRSYKREKQLKVGFSLLKSAGSFDALFGLGILVPRGLQFHGIQIDAGRWLSASAYSVAHSILRISSQSDRSSMELFELVGQPQTMALNSGIVLFLDEPRFAPLGKHDLRTPVEIAADTDQWLERISQSVKSTELDRSRIADLRTVLQNYMDETVEPGEMAQLTAAMRILESRSEIVGLIPEIVRHDGIWNEIIEARLEQETATRLAELEGSLNARRKEMEAELERVEGRLTEARVEVELLGAKKQAYDDAAKRLNETIEEVIEKRLESVGRVATDGADLESLAARIDALQRSIAVHAPVPDSTPRRPEFPIMTAEDRTARATTLAKECGLSLPGFAVLLSSRSAGRLSVLTGKAAGRAASLLVHALSVSPPTIVFCDPTIVSLKDLLDAPGIDGERTIRTAIDEAKADPGTLFPVGLLALTKSPCEYWLPALLAGQQVGQLPRNILFIGSAEPDGSRIGMPTSLLDRVLPLACEPMDGASPALSGAAWPVADEHPSPPQEFLQGLLDLQLQNRHLRDATRQATGLLEVLQCDLETFKAGVGQQMEWLGAVDQDGAKSHPQLRYFEASEA